MPLDGDGNPISEEDPEGSVALDHRHTHEDERLSAEEERPLAPSTPPTSDGQCAHNAVRAPLFNTLSLHKTEHLFNAGPSRSSR